MTDLLLISLCVALLVGAAFGAVEVAKSAMNGRLGPNSTVGLRTRATRKSPQAWQVAHESALPVLRWTACMTTAVGVLSLIILFASDGAEWAEVLSAGSGVILVIGVVIAGIRGHRAATALGVGSEG